MKQLTKNEIVRTAFKYIPASVRKYASSISKNNRDCNDKCPYCKNEDTDIVRDVSLLKPFADVFYPMEFRVLNCHCCDAVFSWYKVAPNLIEDAEASAYLATGILMK